MHARRGQNHAGAGVLAGSDGGDGGGGGGGTYPNASMPHSLAYSGMVGSQCRNTRATESRSERVSPRKKYVSCAARTVTMSVGCCMRMDSRMAAAADRRPLAHAWSTNAKARSRGVPTPASNRRRVLRKHVSIIYSGRGRRAGEGNEAQPAQCGRGLCGCASF
ncbi:hypothetical protein EON67_10405, partial [archaeon]